MAKRVELDDAGKQYALLKDVKQLNAGDRRAIRGAVPLTLASDGKTLIYPGDYDDQMQNALLARIVTEWNLPLTLPKNDPTVLDQLELDQIDKLYEATQEYVRFLNGGVADPSEKDSVPNSSSAS